MNLMSLHELLRSTYDEMMPLCSEMTGIAKGVTGLGALPCIALRVQAPIAHAETTDVFPLLRLFVSGFCIMFFPTFVLGAMNAALSPVVQGTEKMINRQENNLVELAAKRNKLREDTYLCNPETAYLASNGKFGKKVEEIGIIGSEDAVTIVGMYAERAAYQTRQWAMRMMHDLMELLSHAAGLVIDTLRTLILTVLPILGPIVFDIAVWDGLAGSLTAWFSRYIPVYPWLPVSSILTVLLTRIRALMVQKDTEILSNPDYLPDSDIWYCIVFFLIGIVGYFCASAVAGWVTEVGDGIGSYGHSVNQAVQRGIQGAYTGGRYAIAGVGSVVGNVGECTKDALLKDKQ